MIEQMLGVSLRQTYQAGTNARAPWWFKRATNRNCGVIHTLRNGKNEETKKLPSLSFRQSYRRRHMPIHR